MASSSSVKSRVEDLIGEIQDDATAVTQWASDTAREVINLLPQDMLWSVSTTKSDSGGGSGATISLTTAGGVITGVSITAAGSGYLSDPEITVSDSSSGGSSADIRAFSDGGALIALDIVSGGSSYGNRATAVVNVATDNTADLVVDGNAGTIVVDMVVTGTGISGSVTVETVTDQNTLVLSSAQTLGNNVDLVFADSAGTVSAAISGGGGVAVTTAKFLYAEKNGYQANEIDASNKARATDTGSIFYATTKSPAYYREGGTISVVPGGGSVHVVDYPTIAYDNSGVTGVPDDVEHLVIMGAAVKARIGQLATLRADLSEINSPDFQEVEFVLGSIPSISDLTLSEVAPTLVLEPAPTITDLTISSTAPVVPSAPEFSDNVVTLPTTPPAYTAPVTNLSFASADIFITDNEDVELANAELQKVSTQINKYQADMQNQIQKFNEANVEYQAGVQKAIQDAQLDSSKDSKQYESKLRRFNEELSKYQQLVNVEVQEHTINRMQKDLAVWTQKRSNQLQKYIADLDKYKAKTSNEKEVYAINEMQKEIGLYQADQNNKLQKYQGDVGKKSQKFQAEFGVWQTDVSSEFQKHQAMMGELQALQAQYQSGLQNFVASYKLPKGEKDGE